MRHAKRGRTGVLVLIGLMLAACGQPAVEAAPEPAIVLEPIEGTELSHITLTESASARLDIQTAPIESQADDSEQAVPFAAVVYDATGATWVYTSPEPLTFVRHAIEIVRVDGDLAFVSDGPPSDTLVVIVGAAELYGAEQGVGGGH